MGGHTIVVAMIDSYTEVSPSLTGLKIFTRGTLSTRTKVFKRPTGSGQVEVYETGRYFTVTGEHWPEAATTVSANQAGIDAVVSMFQTWSEQDRPQRQNAGRLPEVSADDDRETALAALAVLDPDCGYNQWLRIGQALHSVSPSLVDEFDAWSRQSDKYTNGEPARKWRSFSAGGGVTLSTLCWYADQTGQDWRPKRHLNGNSVDSVYLVYASGEWPEPIPLVSDEVAKFPDGVFPSWLDRYIRELSVATQTPIDLPAGMALAVLSVCCQKKFAVVPRPGWLEPLSLYVLNLMDPANRKTAVVSAVANPVRLYQRQQAETYAPMVRASISKYEVLTKQRNEFVNAAAKAPFGAEREHLMEQVRSIDEEIAANPILTEPLFLADDITPETLATRMLANGGRMGILSAEADAFDVMAGRYSKNGQSNINIYLKSHSGDDHRVDRGSRPSEFLRSPALAIGCLVQPEVMTGLLNQKTFRGRGLLGRFLYQKPVTLLGRREINPPSVDPITEAAYTHGIMQLMGLPANQDFDGQYVPQYLSLTKEARESFYSFAGEIEPQLGEFGRLATITDWAGKLAGQTARIAALLHIAEHGIDGQIPPVVSAESMAAAVTIGRYLMSHAEAVFGMMGDNQTIETAKHVLAAIQRNQLKEFSKRDIHQLVRRRVSSPDDLDRPLTLLEDHHYIRRLPDKKQQATTGRKPSPTYAVNPKSI